MAYFDGKECGQRIRRLRRERDLTQEMLVEELNISVSHMSNIENGTRAPSIDLILIIAEYFGISLDYLVLGRILSDEDVRNSVDDIICGLHTLRNRL